MSGMLERYTKKTRIMMVALCVVVLAAILTMIPKAAEAQEERLPADTQATAQNAPTQEQKAVAPGDTLWTIARERLPANPSERQIAKEVRRIVEQNRDWLAADPDLLYPGQVLLLPPVERPTAEVRTTSGSPERATRRTAAPPAAPSEAEVAVKPESTPTELARTEAVTADGPTGLPELPEAQAVPVTGFLYFVDTAVFGVDRERLGWAILSLTVVLGVLGVWKLPMRREIGDPWGLEARGLYMNTQTENPKTVNARAGSPHPDGYGMSSFSRGLDAAGALQARRSQREHRTDLPGRPLRQDGTPKNGMNT